MAGAPDTIRIPPVSLAICLSSECLDRFGSILRHLVVGLVDHVVRISLVSSDPRVEALALGPTQAIIHPEPRWPLTRRRLHGVASSLASTPPTVIHAMSGHSYSIALSLADEFDTDLVLQVTSLDDCAELERYTEAHIGRILSFTEPLSLVLSQQLKFPQELVEVIGPGVFAANRPSCFSRLDRAPAVVCTAPFVRESGVDRVVEAAQIVQKRGRKAMFFLLGRGPFESYLRKRASDLNVLSTVTFARLCGDSFEAASSADIFVHPGAWRSTYVDALQAMGAGLAVASVADPSADFLIPGETARVCEGNTSLELADAIDDLLADRPMAQRMATHAQEFVRKNHSMSTMADKTAAVYRRLLLARSTFAMRE